MSISLPPLNALRAFDAAARHLSFTKAADELSVTQAAISHQIKGLEDWFGLPLFRRLNRGLVLTEAGQHYLPSVREAFETLVRATADLRDREATRPLTISVQMSLAATWLMPRLYRFQEERPDIDVWVSGSDSLTDFTKDPIDMCIRNGLGDYPGLDSTLIMREQVFPVCSPEYLDRQDAPSRPADLLDHPLIWDEMPMLGHGKEGGRVLWGHWLEAAGVANAKPGAGTFVSHASMAQRMAVEGRGIALSRSAIAADDLRAGRLVRPFATGIPAVFSYFAVCPKGGLANPRIAAFTEWAIREGHETEATVAAIAPVVQSGATAPRMTDAGKPPPRRP